MFLTIGQINIRITCGDLDFIRSAQQEFVEFLCFDNPREYFSIEVDTGYVPASTDLIDVKKRGDVFYIQAEEFKGWFNPAEKTSKVSVADLKGVLNCFLRVFYSLALLSCNGFLVHAAGLYCPGNDRVFVFAGPSESGKTTLASMSGDLKVLSDELVLVRNYYDDIFVFSTPFKGEYKGEISNCSAPLASIAFLSREIENGAARIDEKELFLSLLANVFFFARDDESNQKVINAVKNICGLKPGYKVDLYNHDIRSVLHGIKQEVDEEQISCLAAG